jgi:hypothetical protein
MKLTITVEKVGNEYQAVCLEGAPHEFHHTKIGIGVAWANTAKYASSLAIGHWEEQTGKEI